MNEIRELATKAALATIKMTRAMCIERACGCEGAGLAGTRHRLIRCDGCPLDQTDELADLLLRVGAS